MGERYVLRECTRVYGRDRWEVLHYWADGITVQYRYFRTKPEAEKYLAGKRGVKILREA